MAAYHAWLHGMRRGLEPLRVAMGPQVEKSNSSSVPEPCVRHLDPMPVLIG